VLTPDSEVAGIEVHVSKEEKMKKQLIITLVFVSSSFLLGGLSASAQGRSAGHAAGPGAGAAGMHEPMGMGAAMGTSLSSRSVSICMQYLAAT
jgi:hypothetical protein